MKLVHLLALILLCLNAVMVLMRFLTRMFDIFNNEYMPKEDC